MALGRQKGGPRGLDRVHSPLLCPQWGDLSAPGGCPGPAHHLPLHRGGWGLAHEDRPAGEPASSAPLPQTWAFVRRKPGGWSAYGDLKLFLTLRNLSQQGWGPYRSQREEPLPSPKPQRSSCLLQGDTPRQRAEKAQDTELAAYLENRQHYQMIQREDQETAV